MANFKIRGTYSFDVYPTAVVGNNFKGVTVLAIMDRETADREIDAQSLHLQVYPFLPAGTPDDASGYDYVKVRMPSGQTVILGMAWINEDTITTNDFRTITATIGGVTADDIPRVRDALVMNGFTQLALSIK